MASRCRWTASRHLQATTGPVQIRRENGSRFALVQSNVAGRDLVGFVDEVRAAVEREIHLPTGYSVTWGGQFENQQRAAARLALVIPVSLGADLPGAVLDLRLDPPGGADPVQRAVRDWSAASSRCGCRASTCRCRPRSASSRCWASPCSTAWCWCPISTSCAPPAWR